MSNEITVAAERFRRVESAVVDGLFDKDREVGHSSFGVIIRHDNTTLLFNSLLHLLSQIENDSRLMVCCEASCFADITIK